MEIMEVLTRSQDDIGVYEEIEEVGTCGCKRVVGVWLGLCR